MLGFVGIAVILIMVFGGYVLAGGKMGIILKSLPFEMIMIGGAAIGAFLISNDMAAVKHTLQGAEVEGRRLPRSPVPPVRAHPSGARQSRRAGRAHRIARRLVDLREIPAHPERP
jgi:hypothetical protein